MSAYLFRQVREGGAEYVLRALSESDLKALDAPFEGAIDAVLEAREIAKQALRKAVFAGGCNQWATQVRDQHPWLKDDPEAARYLRECVR